jgi:maltose alpha-D-glucosyltransferase/alpha-amylase
LKLFRKLDEGVNPEVEIGRFLTDKAHFDNIPRVAGTVEYRRGRGRTVSLAVLQSFVPNEGDAWKYTLDSLDSYLEYVLAHPTVQIPPILRRPLLSLPIELPPLAQETIGAYVPFARLLGTRTAELHLSLASSSDDPDFAPEAFTQMYATSLYQSMRGLTIRTLQLLQQQSDSLPGERRDEAQTVIDLKDSILERFQAIRKGKITAQRIRCHGDYHLGQVLFTGKDFVIIDFEGEPARPLSERRLKRSPLRDVAGMIRSFHYAAHSAVLHRAPLLPRPEDDMPVLDQWARFWYTWAASAFLNSYLDAIAPAKLLPQDPEQLQVLLDAYLLEKAIYEIGYELNNRPAWLRVPLQGIIQLMQQSS